MKRLETSGFNPVVDNRSEGGVLWLLIATAVVIALLSVGAVILDRTGFPVPYLLTIVAGVLVGVPLGMGITSCLRTDRSSHHE